MINVTIDGMRESIFGELISEYAPEEFRDEFLYNLRVFIEDDGNFWFVGSEIANIMGYQNTRDALIKHVPEQYKRISVANRDTNEPGPHGNPNPTIILISEFGLYALAMRSKLPRAYEFQEWVYRVISKIRQYGGYISSHPYLKQVVDQIPQHLRPAFANMRGKLTEQQQKLETLTQQLEEQQPKVTFFDMAMDNSNAVPITVIAKDFGMTANELHTILSGLEVLYRLKDTWVLHKAYQNMGLTATKSLVSITDAKGQRYEDVEIATYWTERGRVFVYNKLMAHGYRPLYLNQQ